MARKLTVKYFGMYNYKLGFKYEKQKIRNGI